MAGIGPALQKMDPYSSRALVTYRVVVVYFGRSPQGFLA